MSSTTLFNFLLLIKIQDCTSWSVGLLLVQATAPATQTSLAALAILALPAPTARSVFLATSVLLVFLAKLIAAIMGGVMTVRAEAEFVSATLDGVGLTARCVPSISMAPRAIPAFRVGQTDSAWMEYQGQDRAHASMGGEARTAPSVQVDTTARRVSPAHARAEARVTMEKTALAAYVMLDGQARGAKPAPKDISEVRAQCALPARPMRFARRD
mmetsp:Transcript_12307/g.33006  ORF Transcript_12307/g.33006 Transcript_12307/m.33006 type:complete len:214 (-) Transcript_12307:1118-1759(-)